MRSSLHILKKSTRTSFVSLLSSVPTGPVPPREVFRLRVAVRTEEPQIFMAVVEGIAIDVVELKG